MQYEIGKDVVISLGGSIVFPNDKPDIEFLKAFKKLVVGEVKKGRKFMIVVGGGKLCRLYNEVASSVSRVTPEDQDWLGIHVTRLNAHLLRTIFRDIANPTVCDNRRKLTPRLRYPVNIGSGWRPGNSTDYVTACCAYAIGCNTVINASKPTHVYDKDPNKFSDAKAYTSLSWSDYLKLIPKKWVPGANTPFDPLASKFAKTNRMTAIFLNGNNLANFRHLLEGNSFEGTIIS